MATLEDVQEALANLNNAIIEYTNDAQAMVQRYEAAHENMKDVVSAASKLIDEQSGWFFRVAVPADDMDALSTSVQKMRGISKPGNGYQDAQTPAIETTTS